MIDYDQLGGVDAVPHEDGGWIKEPRRNTSAVFGSGVHYYVNDVEVSKDEYRRINDEQHAADVRVRKEREFEEPNDAFAYASTLDDGVVLDWGRCYAAMERSGLLVGFVINPSDQPIVTRDDLLVRAGPQFILVRRNVKSRHFGGCGTDFCNPANSYSEDIVEVLDDGTGRYQKGQWLQVRVSPDIGARVSVGSNWRMKLLKPEDVQAVLPRPLLTTKEPE